MLYGKPVFVVPCRAAVFYFFYTLDNGDVYINADPSYEYTQTMYMEICVNDRRNKVCGTLTIEFIGELNQMILSSL